MSIRRKHDRDPVYQVGSPRLSALGKIGLTLLIAGILPWAYAVVRLHSHNWRPLFVEPSLDSKQFATPPFQVDLSGIYDVILVFPHPQDERRLDCMAGEHFGHECDVIQRSLYLRWSVLEDNGSVLSSALYTPSGFSGSSEGFGVDLGAFHAQRGHVYRLRLNPGPQSASLELAHPKLLVSAANIYWEKWMIAAQAGLLLAVFSGSIGFLLLAFDLAMIRLQRRRLPRGAADRY